MLLCAEKKAEQILQQCLTAFLGYRSGRAPGTFKKKVVKTSADQNRQLQRLAEKSLGGSNLRQQVKLPPGEDLDEWLAYNCT